MKEFFDHSFRYTIFFAMLYLLYLVATGFEKPESSSALVHGASIILIAAVLGMIVAGVAKLIRR